MTRPSRPHPRAFSRLNVSQNPCNPPPSNWMSVVQRFPSTKGESAYYFHREIRKEIPL